MSKRQEPALRSIGADPQTLGPRIRAMARWVAAGTQDTKILAERFGMTPQRVVQIKNSSLFKVEVHRLESRMEDAVVDVRKELSSLGARALENIAEEVHDNVRSNVRTRVSFDILDRIGHAPRQDSGHHSQNLQINILAPMPGEDPIVAEARLADIRTQVLEAQKKAQKEEEDE